MSLVLNIWLNIYKVIDFVNILYRIPNASYKVCQIRVKVLIVECLLFSFRGYRSG